MDIFFTSYTYRDLGEDLHPLYMALNRTLSERVGGNDYGDGVQKWFLMFIMVPPGVPGHDDPERKMFQKKPKAFDLRLHLSNDDFEKADEAGRKRLVAEVALRSIDVMAAKKVPDFDAASLKADVTEVLKDQGWI